MSEDSPIGGKSAFGRAALLLQTPQSKLSLAHLRLTFDDDTLYSARFQPDGSIVYGAAGSHKPPKPR